MLKGDSDGRLFLGTADVGNEVCEVTVTIPRNDESPSLGLLLEEIASSADVGIVAIEGLVEGGNGERATKPLLPGDALAAVAELGRPDTSVSLEGLTYDAVIERLVALDSSVGVVLQVKRLERRPRANVKIVFPEVEEREAQTITLYQGTNLRRAMLSQGVVLNDPLARRFDAGVGTGDCGGEGCCCTCAVEVATGVEMLSGQGPQEAQMLRRFPRWRLACKAVVGALEEDAELTIKVQPRNFEGFYGAEECDIDGVPLSRDGIRTKTQPDK